ncbi:hypothetical protein ACH4PU_30840 [Streptomyces sp. NPDC021100]|uniref:hypothetical protein n=1 Tax=Streptomyces sp. NPDC021100 TaxID=3365114 RepID=UPI0037A5ED98
MLTMQRSLTRRLLRAYDRLPVSDDPCAHLIAITIAWRTAPEAAWTPGPGFIRSGRFWARDNGDGTHTGVIAGFRPTGGDMDIPAWDGRPGPWSDDEVWTLTTPRPEDLDNELNAKAYRVLPFAFAEDVTLTREPYTGHPAEAADDYRRHFAGRYGVSPQALAPTGTGYRLALSYRPNLAGHPVPAELARGLSRFAREAGATIRVRRTTGERWERMSLWPQGADELSRALLARHAR